MQHEDGYCDACGCEVDTAQLTFDGRALCDECTKVDNRLSTSAGARRPEARDDGR